jgi:hypothetical protein
MGTERKELQKDIGAYMVEGQWKYQDGFETNCALFYSRIKISFKQTD